MSRGIKGVRASVTILDERPYATQLSMYDLAVGMSQAMRAAAEMQDAMTKVSVILRTPPDEARRLLARTLEAYPSLTPSEASKRLLRERLHARPEPLSAWAERELQRPKASAQHRTVLVMGKPYHWRQDYTGQLRLVAGASPW